MRILSVKASMTMRQLTEAAVHMSTTMLTVAEAAWASVLAQTLLDTTRAGKKPPDIQFGTVMNGRRNQDALRCVAPLLAAVPMRLLVDGTRPLTNSETCELLAEQGKEAQPYLQIPCPTLAHAQMGANCFDTVLLVQALRPEATHSNLRELPGYNFEENLMLAYKETDSGYLINTELWPGRQSWDEKMLLRCIYNVQRPDYEFLTGDWVHGALAALDEALIRITFEPDALFYTG